MKNYLRLFAMVLIPISLVNIVVAGYYLLVFQPRQQVMEQEAEKLFDEAQLLCEQTNYHGAILKYLKVVERHPGSVKYPLSLYHIGTIYLEQLGEIPRARYAYETMLLKFPENDNAIAVRRRLAYMSAVGDSGGVPFKLYSLAQLEVRRQRHQAAVDRMRRIIDRYPGCGLTPELYGALAALYADKLNDPATAQLYRDRLAREYPHFNLTQFRPY